MARRSIPRRKVTKIHWGWIILAVIAVAIPLTIFISGQNTDNRQHASRKGNKVLDVKLSGDCKDNRKNGENTYRRAEYLCENGKRGEIPNRNNSCEKRADWMTRAQELCDRQGSVTPSPTFTPTYTPTQSQVTPSQDPNAPKLSCTPLGTQIAAQLLDSNKKPIYNATISWSTSPDLRNTSGFSKMTITAPFGNGATYNFVSPDQQLLSQVDVYGSYEYKLPSSQASYFVSCRVTLNLPTPTPTR